MVDELDDARRDLAFLRGLVEDSSDSLRPLGAILVIAGVVHAISALRFWAVAAGWLVWPAPLSDFMGADAVIVQVAAMLVYARLTASRPKAAGPAARAVSGAVGALGWALASGLLGLLAAGYRTGGSNPIELGLPILLFALAGATWHVVYAVYRRPWALGSAIASALFALGVGLSANGPAGPPLIAAGLLVCLAAPGLALMRQAQVG